MSDSNDRIKHIILKFNRAKYHIENLEYQINEFIKSNPYKVGFKHDPHTKQLIYYVVSALPVPDIITLQVGDAIQNLMGTLDHLAYQLVCRDCNDNPPSPSRIYFPIADDLSNYEKVKHLKLNGVSKKTMSVIDKIKPYKGGNDNIWILNRLNNIEKHRLLLTVGSAAGGINFAQLTANQTKGFFPPEAQAAFEAMKIFIVPENNGFPINPGFELFRGLANDQPNPKQEFLFDIVLNEPGIIEGKPILPTVISFVEEVNKIIDTLIQRLY